MEKNYLKQYIEFSNAFRKSNDSKESVENIYDLLYELENVDKSKEDNLVLSNVYILLGFHKSAYEVFKEIVDLSNNKEVSKLYVMEQKAKSHGNNFSIKDIRKLKEKKELPKLTLSDFKISKEDNNKFEIPQKEIVIFNKNVKGKISIYIPDLDIEKYSDTIFKHINGLSDCKNELIKFYNQNNEFTNIQANDYWYDTLDIYSIQITLNNSGDIETLISVGDTFSQDHILDIELTNQAIVSMNYDG
ncbi:hypothetical protein L1276_002454 [Flavobacterium sp. HSC-32F16]|uniref:hypothetical protein n=1 Tax=Flavobacterium sp. HSC-32F16 TaxID=2910964 RepID=UPI0020A447E7|nr:hypothetical protein [Flavobacterium sp. HSC-32F16]MCP2027297.1 hypothetical protein [Flavobacterium sp. HSC-32F16]